MVNGSSRRSRDCYMVLIQDELHKRSNEALLILIRSLSCLMRTMRAASLHRMTLMQVTESRSGSGDFGRPRRVFVLRTCRDRIISKEPPVRTCAPNLGKYLDTLQAVSRLLPCLGASESSGTCCYSLFMTDLHGDYTLRAQHDRVRVKPSLLDGEVHP